MMLYAENQQQLIDRTKLALGTESYNQMGKILGVPYTTFSKAYKNQHFLSDYYILLLCDVSGLEPLKTLAHIRNEEAKSKGKFEQVKFWEKQANAA